MRLSEWSDVIFTRQGIPQVPDADLLVHAFRRYPGGGIIWLTPIRPLSILLGSWWPSTGRIGALKNKFSS